jgi:ligand-binding sensor protein
MKIEQRKLVDFFNVDKLQAIQDMFAYKTGVASIITEINGAPITKPSNFCRLCINVIRKTKLGLANCMKSDSVIGRHNSKGPTIQPCLSGGLWDAGSSFTINQTHTASWLIGQVMNEEQAFDLTKIMAYGEKIGADINEFSYAISFVTVMDLDKFTCISNALFLFSTTLSELAFNAKAVDLNEGRQKLLQLVSPYHSLQVLVDTWDRMTNFYQDGSLLLS